VTPSTDPSASVQFDLSALVEAIADRVVVALAVQLAEAPATPWMLMEEAIEYTRIPEGTFRKWVAEGRLPSHGGKRRLFHRAELDAALGYHETSNGSHLQHRARSGA
jgi:excisionase family DNA binding protein